MFDIYFRTLDAGYWFTQDGGLSYPHRGSKIQIPTLQELLDEFLPEKQLILFFDFKEPQVVKPVLQVRILTKKQPQIIRDLKIGNRVILGAVPPPANQILMANRDPEWITCADFSTMKTIVWDNMFGRITPEYPIHHDVVGFYVNSFISWV